MSGDDLFAPLGYSPDPAPRAPRQIPWRVIRYGGLAVACSGVVALAWITDTGMGGEPFAVAKIERAPPRAPNPPVQTTAAVVEPVEGASVARPSSLRASGAEVEADSGVRVVRRGGGETPGALIIHVPDVLGVQLPPAPDRRLVEKGRFGSLPKVGADGSRPAEVYARPVVTGAEIKQGAPRIALVVGGMGLSLQATQNAVGRLPGAVTLAFAPYGADLDKQVARAREGGHEVILQAPMEPWDAAQNPGPRTLQTSLTPEQNIENLHWLMSRFTGYVGIANFLGAKFSTDEAAFTPILRETASRGLFYLDDASSTQSLAQRLAPGTGASVMRADVNIDVVQKAEAIDAELGKLERLARQNGAAIGVATGLPTTVDQVARFARGLEKRGIALVPLSSLAAMRAIPVAGNGR